MSPSRFVLTKLMIFASAVALAVSGCGGGGSGGPAPEQGSELEPAFREEPGNMGGGAPPPDGTSFSAGEQLTVEVASNRLSQAGYNPRSERDKSKLWNEVDVRMFSVGDYKSPNTTSVEVHEFTDSATAEKTVAEIANYANGVQTGSQIVTRTYLIDNLVTYIGSPSNGANGSDIEDIAKSIASS